jgi:hypothetical protein
MKRLDSVVRGLAVPLLLMLATVPTMGAKEGNPVAISAEVRSFLSTLSRLP